MKSKRLMELMNRVTARERFTVQELADEFGVSYRTMWRYLQELSELGVPLYSEPGAAGGYRVLRKEQATPGRGRLVDLPAFHLVGFQFQAPFSARAEAGVLVPRLWMQLLSRAEEIRHLVDPSVRLGLALHHPEEFTYFMGFQVAAVEAVPPEMFHLSVPAHRYARFTHHGSMERERVDATFLGAYAWLKAQGYQRDRQAYWIERFDRRYDPASPANAFEIDLPLTLP